MMKRTEYWIRQGQGKAIVLLHGIGGKDSQEYWHAFLSVLTQDGQLRDYGIFVWQYPTHLHPGRFNNIMTNLRRKTLQETAPPIGKLGSAWKTVYDTQFQDVQEVFLVCHSMGGLVVKSWILEMLELGQSAHLAMLRHIAFYATPHQGAPITTLAGWNRQLQDLRLDSPFIERVQKGWYDHVVAWKVHVPEPAVERFHRYIPHLVFAGVNDRVVPSMSATIAGMPLTIIPGDHSQVIAPLDRNDTRYKAWKMDMEKSRKNPIVAHDPASPSTSAPLASHPAKSFPKESSHGQEHKPNSTHSSSFPSTVPIPQPAAAPSTNTQTPFSSGKTQAVQIFLAYADNDEDKEMLRQLETHLSALQRNGDISIWHKQHLVPGADWAGEIRQQIEHASLILFLVSADFLSSDVIYHAEVKRALERRKTGQALVVPILVRPADWEDTAFGHLQPIPGDKTPISIWPNRDSAWLQVVNEIKQLMTARSEFSIIPNPPTPLPPRKNLFPPLWNVPYRYPAFFTGRDALVEQLFGRFRPDFSGGIAPWALTGLGGMGKTQTAVAYAYHHRHQYQSVLWVNAETESNLLTSIQGIARLLALSERDLNQHERIIDEIQHWFEHTTDWLLIVDNADNLGIVRPFLPRTPNGHVLLTSREKATGDGGTAQSHELSPLSPDDGALCLLRRANYIPWTGQLSDAPSSTSVKAAQELTQLMGGLPLALEQAGAYIEITGRGVGGYLELYKRYRPEIQQRYYGDIHMYREAVAFAWMIACERLAISHPVALEMLYLCAYLATDAIPYQLFSSSEDVLGPVLGPVAANELRLDLDIMAPLRKHSLIQNQAHQDTDISQIFLHRVLQEVLQGSLEPDIQLLWAERAVALVGRALPRLEWPLLQAHAHTCLHFIEQWQMTSREADLIRHHVEMMRFN